jgi:uncharacterized membrane protein YphA (DoxX/SURF4 family)
MFPVLRLLIGCLFLVSGGEKLIWPYQNFLYVLQSYQLLPPGLDTAVARIFPWMEFIAGLFLVLGFWLPVVLRCVLMFFTTFILIIAQALLRKLPIDECGCFGQLLSLKPQHTLIMDSILFLLTFLSLANIKKTEAFSLDRYLQK